VTSSRTPLPPGPVQEELLAQYQLVVGILERVQAAPRFRQQAMALCNELAAQYQAEQVALGVMKSDQVHVLALDHAEQFSRNLGRIRALEEAMAECLDQGAPVIYPAAAEAPYISRMAEALAREDGAAQVIVVPLFFEQQPVMALALLFGPAAPFTLEGLSALRLLTTLAAPRLYEQFLQDCWFGLRWARRMRHTAAVWLGPEQTWLKLALLGVTLLFLFSVLVKGRYRIEAPLIIESTERRIITAPFTGFIESVTVLPGDPVTGGKSVLLRLDDRDLRLQVREAEAEQYTFRKQADLARAEAKPAESQVAEGKERQAAAKLGQLRDRLERSVIVSPVDGFVRSKDLHREAGRQVSAGEPLLEVEALASLKAVVRVAETDIVDLAQGQPAEVVITAHPEQRFSGIVERIVPAAAVVNGKNVFEAWVTLDRSPTWLRPAMEGEARVTAGRRRFIWLWTHRVTDWLRMRLWI